MSDLDDEELEATRKLNGADKTSNIEEDINLIKLKEISERFSNGTETIEDIINYCRNYEIKFENGLKLRVVEKRYFDKLVERIKELEDDLYSANCIISDLTDSIPVQKVKDKIEENNKIMIDTQNKYPGTYAMLDEWRNAKAQNDILEELLEDK